MNILTQAIELAYTKWKENLNMNDLELYLSSQYWNPSSWNYARLNGFFDQSFHKLARDSLIELIKLMDQEYRNSSERKRQYYVKNTRERTIVTIFGPITYKRTEYQHRKTGESYCYIDRKIGLDKRIRYDQVVCSMAYEMYAHNNSMIDVGKALGDRIYGYSLNKDRNKETIPRQTIWRMLNRFQSITIPYPQAQESPNTLYIMADEKYIPLQGKDKPSNKLMNKIAVSFEGIDTSQKRSKLSKPTYFYYKDGNFWEQTFDHLSQIYDLDKIKTIYLLGDGATWIKTGVEQMKGLQFGLCKFHFSQAINHITNNKKLKSIIMDYAIHNDRKNLKYLFQSILSQHPERNDVLQEKCNYILNNLQAVHVMYTKVKIGCPMEQVIQHVLQSNFTSIPKAYSHKYLPTYINARINYMNQYDLRVSYLLASDIQSNNPTIHSNDIDLSSIDKDPNQHTYHLHLPYPGAWDKIK